MEKKTANETRKLDEDISGTLFNNNLEMVVNYMNVMITCKKT